MIRSAIAKMGQGASIVIATDNDAAGRELAEQITAIAAESARVDLAVVRDLPEGEGSDWNDRLKVNPAPSAPKPTPGQ